MLNIQTEFSCQKLKSKFLTSLALLALFIAKNDVLLSQASGQLIEDLF